jgi:hypothetical protein
VWYRFGGSEMMGAGGFRTLDGAGDLPVAETTGTEEVSVMGMSSGVGGRIRGGYTPGGAVCVGPDGRGLMSTGSVAEGCASDDGNCAPAAEGEVGITSM